MTNDAMVEPDPEDPAMPDRGGVLAAVRASMRLLTPGDRLKYWLAVGAQMSLALLDLVGVLLIGILAAVAMASISPSAALPSTAQTAIERLGLADVPLLTLAIGAALLAAGFFAVKSVASVWLVRRILFFLAGRQAQVASRLAGELFNRPLTFMLRRTSQQTAYALMESTTNATVLLLGSLALLLADVALLLVLTVALMFIDPLVTMAAISFFVVIALILQKALGSAASRASAIVRDASIRGRTSVQDGLSAYREISAGNRRSLYRDRISGSVWEIAGANANLQFVAQVPKFVFELALVLGALGLFAAQARLANPASAVGTMALFLAASARVMPSLLRLQVSLITIKQSEMHSRPAYELDADLGRTAAQGSDFDFVSFESGVASNHAGFNASVTLRDVTFSYPGADHPAIAGASLEVPPGTSIALVGATGSGKSTLADLMLGVLTPDSGEVRIGGVGPLEATRSWQGAMAYVPQSVALVAGTVRDNVALGFPDEFIDDDRVWEALEQARLAEFLRVGREGLGTVVGEHGVRLSGGQRQRLGIARALYSRPALLVLDEATSALDAETEALITEMLTELAGRVTTVTVAHRLATVRRADVVLYLEDGRVAACGTFDQVRNENPSFDNQARLLGL